MPQPAIDPKFEGLRRKADSLAMERPAAEKRRRYGFQSSQQRLSQYNIQGPAGDKGGKSPAENEQLMK